MNDAKVEQLGEARTYEKEINGIRHGVIEVRYAIFPQKSGTLEIPAQAFSATLVDRGSDDYNPFGPRPGRQMRVTSPSIPLQVRPKPADYPADAPWMPARALSISESWSPQPEQAQVGESLTRNVLLKVEGLSGTQLPPLPLPDVQGLRRYPDQPQLADQSTDQGLIGSREEREALVPEQAGRIELPALEVVWWNTREDRLERTSLPPRTLEVAAAPQAEAEPPAAALPLGERLEPTLWPWQLATAVLALTTLLGFGLWWRARQLPAVIRAAANGPSSRSLLDELRRACLANDPQATRQALTPGLVSNPIPWPTWRPASCRCPTPWMASTARCTARAAIPGRARTCGGRSAPCPPRNKRRRERSTMAACHRSIRAERRYG